MKLRFILPAALLAASTACDSVLQTVARVLALNLRDGDLVCRKGGDHFSVLLPSTKVETATVMASDLQKALESTCFRDADGQRMDVRIRAVAQVLSASPEPVVHGAEARV